MEFKNFLSIFQNDFSISFLFYLFYFEKNEVLHFSFIYMSITKVNNEKRILVKSRLEKPFFIFIFLAFIKIQSKDNIQS